MGSVGWVAHLLVLGMLCVPWARFCPTQWWHWANRAHPWPQPTHLLTKCAGQGCRGCHHIDCPSHGLSP